MSTAHLHLLLNHVPVVGTVLGITLLAWALIRRNESLVRVTFGLFVVLAVTAVAVYLTGEPAEELVEGLPGVTDGVIGRHEDAALVATVGLGLVGATALSLLVAFRSRALPRILGAITLAGALAAGGLMAWTANLGGQIRHTEIRPGDIAGIEELEGGEHRR